MEPVLEKTAKPIKIKLRQHQETAEEEAKDEQTKFLRRRPRKRNTEQQGEGTGPKQDSNPKTRSVVVEPRTEEEPINKMRTGDNGSIGTGYRETYLTESLSATT